MGSLWLCTYVLAGWLRGGAGFMRGWLRVSGVIWGIRVASRGQWGVHDPKGQHLSKNYIPLHKTLFTDLSNTTFNWLVVWKMTWGIWQVFSRALKIGILMGSLIQTWKSMSLKSTEELSVMTMKNYAKFEEELTCDLKVDMRNLTNFDPSTWESQKFSF